MPLKTEIAIASMLIVLTGIAHPAQARARCEDVFQNETSRKQSTQIDLLGAKEILEDITRQKTLFLDAVKLRDLETAFESFLRKWNRQDQAYKYRINQDGHILEREGTRLWGANREFKVYTTSRHGSDTYVDYEIIKDGGVQSPVLQRVSVEDFIERVRSSFIHALKPEYREYNRNIDIVLVPLRSQKRNHYDVGRILNINYNSRKRVQEADVQFANGVTSKYNIDDLIKWNVHVNTNKLGDLADFLSLGGKGFVHFFPRTSSYGIVENQATALYIQKMPPIDIVKDSHNRLPPVSGTIAVWG